ncbi:hypothetical protein B0H34DRAFT_796202 [Crassisporium funariophilum]|nr:hypothetical protein B0H34DRAFT_796202 [Crassisporium funariophilum]
MRASSVCVFALPVLAAATAIPRDGGSCNTGAIQCCNSVQSSTSTNIASLAGLLGLDLGSLGALVGLTCNPISVLGLGGNSCPFAAPTIHSAGSSALDVPLSISTFERSQSISAQMFP